MFLQVLYHIKDWTLDPSRFPPFIPPGKYKVVVSFGPNKNILYARSDCFIVIKEIIKWR